MCPYHIAGKFQAAAQNAATASRRGPAFEHLDVEIRVARKLFQKARRIDACSSQVAAGKTVVPRQPDLLHRVVTMAAGTERFECSSTIRSIPCRRGQARSSGPAWDSHPLRADRRALRTDL